MLIGCHVGSFRDFIERQGTIWLNLDDPWHDAAKAGDSTSLLSHSVTIAAKDDGFTGETSHQLQGDVVCHDTASAEESGLLTEQLSNLLLKFDCGGAIQATVITKFTGSHSVEHLLRWSRHGVRAQIDN